MCSSRHKIVIILMFYYNIVLDVLIYFIINEIEYLS